MAEHPTPEEYQAAKAEYAELVRQLDAARQAGDHKRRAAIAKRMLPLEDVLNVYEGLSHE